MIPPEARPGVGRVRVAALIERDGAMLVVRQRARGASGRHDGAEYLTPPGGGVEPGETPEEAVAREVREEVGLEVEGLAPVARVRHEGGATLLFQATVGQGSPVLGVDPEIGCDCPRMVGVDWVPAPPRSVWTGADADAWLRHEVGEVLLREAQGPSEYPLLVAIWRSAVEATHDFLAAADLVEIEARLAPDYLPRVHLVVAERDGVPVGFAGVADGSLEMLFVDAAGRGRGVGSRLLEHAIAAHGVRAVDVNEQNAQALGFYEHAGFTVTGRSPVDDEGRPYPLLHLTLAR